MLSEWRRRLHLWDPNGYVPPSNVKEVDKGEELKTDPTKEFEETVTKHEGDIYEEVDEIIYDSDSDDDLL